MPNWDAKTCGRCGFVTLGDALEKIVCPVCGKTKCISCYGNTGKMNMCVSCAMKDPRIAGSRTFAKLEDLKNLWIPAR